METVGANFHPANGPAKTDNEKYEIAERLLDVGFRWFGISARMRVIGTDDGEALRLGRIDPAAAVDLGEVVNRRDFVAPRRVRCAVARGHSLQDFTRTADEQSAAFVGRVTPRVRDDRRQRFAIDADVRQPGPR